MPYLPEPEVFQALAPLWFSGSLVDAPLRSWTVTPKLLLGFGCIGIGREGFCGVAAAGGFGQHCFGSVTCSSVDLTSQISSAIPSATEGVVLVEAEHTQWLEHGLGQAFTPGYATHATHRLASPSLLVDQVDTLCTMH